MQQFRVGNFDTENGKNVSAITIHIYSSRQIPLSVTLYLVNQPVNVYLDIFQSSSSLSIFSSFQNCISRDISAISSYFYSPFPFPMPLQHILFIKYDLVALFWCIFPCRLKVYTRITEQSTTFFNYIYYECNVCVFSC